MLENELKPPLQYMYIYIHNMNIHKCTQLWETPWIPDRSPEDTFSFGVVGWNSNLQWNCGITQSWVEDLKGGSGSHQTFQVPKMEGFLNLIRSYKAILEWFVPLHKTYIYIYCIGEDSSILGTFLNVWWLNVSGCWCMNWTSAWVIMALLPILKTNS